MRVWINDNCLNYNVVECIFSTTYNSIIDIILFFFWIRHWLESALRKMGDTEKGEAENPEESVSTVS